MPPFCLSCPPATTHSPSWNCRGNGARHPLLWLSLCGVQKPGQWWLAPAQGVESLIEFHPTALGKGEKHFGDLSIFISAAYDHARYVDAITSANGQEVNLEGNILENAPEWLVRDGITYNYKFISTTIQTSYVSEIYSDALNTAEATANGVLGIVPSYFIVDWNATFRFKAYNIKAGINNLNNEKYYTRRINNYPGPGILPADGRTFFVSLGKEF